MPVDILRVGMAGSLGYEIHCRMEDSVAIYRAVMAKGEQFGLRQLGWQSYRNALSCANFAIKERSTKLLNLSNCCGE